MQRYNGTDYSATHGTDSALSSGIVAAEVGVASVLMKKGDFIGGMAWLRQSAEKDNQEALHYLAQVYGETGDVELQKRCCLRLVELGDMSPCLILARIFKDDMELELLSVSLRKLLLMKRNMSCSLQRLMSRN